MVIRCQNCGASLPALGAGREVVCVACGVTQRVPVSVPSKPAKPAKPLEPPRREEPPIMRKAMRQIYNPIPRPLLYLAGALLALGLLAPFWISLITDRPNSQRVILSEETARMVPPPSTNAVSTASVLTERPPGSSVLDQFLGLRLDTTRDDVQRRFNLVLQNTRGMEPEIYGANREGELEQIRAHFYNHLLKEFSIVCRERRVGLDVVEKELLDQFSAPQQRTDATNQPQTAVTGLGLTSLAGANGGDDLNQKFAKFPLRRDLVWADNANRIEATLYYTSNDPVLCTTMLAVHVNAAAWLKTQKPQMGLGNQLLVPEAPRRLFP